MKILSSFTHPQVVPNLYECLCSAEHKGRYSEECGKQSSSGAPLTSIVFFFSYYGSQWCPKTAWLQTFFKISSFVFSRTKKFIQVWNYLRVSKWQNFLSWVNYPFNTGFHATWAKSFSTLPPDSRTLVSKWNTKLALIWKEDFGPLGNSPVLLLLSPGKTPLTLSVVQEWLNKRNTTTVAKFLDTSVCGGSWCLDPSLSPFLVKFTQILESVLLDNPHKAAVLSVGCASFSSTLFPST